MSGQPYSEKAMHAAIGSNVRPSNPTPGLRRVFEALDAAHDREALGLDASVCARTLLAEIVEKLNLSLGDKRRSGEWFARWLAQEYEL